MLHPRLPTRAEDTWDCGFFIDPAPTLHGVSGRGGLVLASGENLYMLRPGAESMMYRESPLDDGLIVVAAAEPRAPWRYAVASDTLVAIFLKNKTEDATIRLRPSEDSGSATHLAWARNGDATSLYVRWEDGSVVRTAADMSGVEPLDLPPMNALASDSAGNLALASFEEGQCRVFRSRDGSRLTVDELDLAADPDGHVHLAVADQAVAFAVERGGAYLSRAAGAPFARCEQLATAGPLEFDGASSDAALFGAIQSPAMGAIVRVDRDGAAMRIAEFGNDAGDVAQVTALSWDSSRHRLWVASPEMGLFVCTAPSAKHRKKGVMS